MSDNTDRQLSRRERQIMDILYEKGRASSAQVVDSLPDPPSYSAVRALLRVLEEKGHVRHVCEGPRYVYLPKRARRQAGHSALRRVLRTFYHGSIESAVAGLLEVSDTRLKDEDLRRLRELIENKRRDRRR